MGILGVSRDISKRKKVELALRRREEPFGSREFAPTKFLQSESWEKDITEYFGAHWANRQTQAGLISLKIILMTQ